MNQALATIPVFLPLLASIVSLLGILHGRRLWVVAMGTHLSTWLCFSAVLVAFYLNPEIQVMEGFELLAATPWSDAFAFHWDFWSIFLAWVASAIVVSLHFITSGEVNSRALVASMSAYLTCFYAALGAANLLLFGIAMAGAILPRLVMISLDSLESKIDIAMEATVIALIATLSVFIVVLSISNATMPSWIGIVGEQYEITASTIGFFLLLVGAMSISGVFPFHASFRKIYGLNRLNGMGPLVLQSALGIFLMFKFATKYFPNQVRDFSQTLLYFYASAALLSAVGFWGARTARDRIFWLQQVLLSFVMVGFFSLNQKGWHGGASLLAFQSLAIPALLFLSICIEKRGSKSVASHVGNFPWLGAASILLPLIILGAPISLGFYCFILILWSLAGNYATAIPLAMLAIPICAFSGMRLMFFRLGEGEKLERNPDFCDFSPRERAAVYPSLAFLLMMGIAPGIFLAPIGSAVAAMLKAMN